MHSHAEENGQAIAVRAALLAAAARERSNLLLATSWEPGRARAFNALF
jgi:hypothetical protein